jgi:hypothetical protein
LKVPKAISLALENFHFGVKAFGDAVVACEAPHAGDFLSPGMECVTELSQWREPATTKGGARSGTDFV